MIFQETVKLSVHEQGATDITSLVNELVSQSGITTGIAQLFLHSSHSGLLINDTVDDDTKSQTMEFLAQLAPTSDEVTSKIERDIDALPDSVRNLLMQNHVSFPIKNSKAFLGAWRGIYLCKCSDQVRQHSISITVIGE
jgi:secondary thiamine-phosphate synthase enzyme